METVPTPERTFEEMCEATYQQMLAANPEECTELPASVPPVDFLRWVVAHKGALLHGSNNQSITKLEPRLANCAAKEFGNLEAVYAVEDPVLPTFYAIKDKERFQGRAISGTTTHSTGDQTTIRYEFAVSQETLVQAPWSDGAVYLLPRESFIQGHDNDGTLIDEWASTTPVTPLGKIRIAPEDFPYLNQITPIQE